MKHRIFNRHVLLQFILGALIGAALFVFGAAGLLLPVILYLDHEIEALSAVTVIGWTVGCAMILSGLLRIRYLKKASRNAQEK